jgi:hypothetical protein
MTIYRRPAWLTRAWRATARSSAVPATPARR